MVPSGASFDEVNNIKIGDDLKPVDNNASEINLTSEQQATQDYIDQQEQELADSEASLPYDPSAPVSSSSSSLGGLSNQNGLDAGSIKIGDDLNPVSTTTSGDGSTLPYDPSAPVSSSSSSLGGLSNQNGLDAGSIKIGDDLNPVSTTTSGDGSTLPYDPSAPVSSSSSSLGGLSNLGGLDAGGIKIGDDLNPVSTTTSGDGSTLVTPTTSTTSTSPSPTFPTSQEGTPAGVQVQNSSDTTGIQNANADSPANTANGLAGCSGTVFEQIKCKILQFLSSLRTIAYVISGFGIIFFAWAAIFGKVNWKHLSSIGVGLFLLSMIGPFIEYFSGDSSVKSVLGYGNFIDGEFKYVEGTPYGGTVDSSQVPDTNVENNNSSSIITGGGKGTDSGESEGKKKMSLTDLFNAGKSAVNTIKNVSTAIRDTDWDINNLDNIITNVKTTIESNSNGFENIKKLAQTGAAVVGGEGLNAIDTSKEQGYWEKGKNYAQKIGDLFKKDKSDENSVDPSKPYMPDSSSLGSQASSDGLNPGKINLGNNTSNQSSSQSSSSLGSLANQDGLDPGKINW